MDQTSSAPSSTTRHVALVLLFVIGALSYMDRYILLILVEPIKAELHLTDTQLGLLNGVAFALLYTVLGVPVAMLADRTHRVRLIAAACFLWSLFTAAGGLANSFLTLAVARMGVGIGEAGSTAPALSILSDYYPPHRRSLVIGVFTSSSAVGIFAGSTLAGWVAQTYGWREALLCVGALGLLASPLFLIFVREPVRGAADPVALAPSEPAPPLRTTIKLFFRLPSLRYLMVGQSLASLVAVGLMAWAPAFLMRAQGMSILEMGAWFGLASGLSMGIGIFGGGAIANVFTARSPRAYPLIPCAFMLIATPFLIAMVLAPAWQTSLLFMLLPKGLTAACNVASMALVQNLTPVKARATACALLVLTINVFGVAGGPLFVGMISDATAPLHGIDSLRIGLLSLAPVCLISAAAFYACSRVVTADMNATIKGVAPAPTPSWATPEEL